MNFNRLRLYIEICKATNTIPTWENLIKFDRQQARFEQTMREMRGE